MSSYTCNSILLMSCLYIVSIPLVKEMGSCDYRGSWPSGHGLISKCLGNGGPIFNSCNRKCSKNNFMLTKCSLTHFSFMKKKTHTHKRKVVVGSMSNLSVKKKKKYIYIYIFIGGGCYIQCDTTLCFIYKLTFAIMKTQFVLSLFIYVLSLPPHDNLLLGKIINFVTWKHHLLCQVFLSHPKSKLVPTLPSRFPYGHIH